MNQLVSHIEFLLHEHNCVIVPDLGGFVVNSTSAQRNGISDFYAPACELVFNRDLTHNDGLLAQSYMKIYDLTFEAATRKIEKAVQEVKHGLREQRHLELGKLGSFTMNDDKRFIYTPAAFTHPSLFGLTQASLKPLIQMHVPALPTKSENKTSRLRVVSMSAAAVAAVVLLMFILPVSDTAIHHQSAQMMSETGWFSPKADKPAVTTAVQPVENEAVNPVPETTETAILPEEAIAPVVETVIEKAPIYHIIVGVYERPEGADKIMDVLKSQGFPQAAQFKRSGRIDVSAASFTDKSAAEAYLHEIHKQHPSFSDAWILKR